MTPNTQVDTRDAVHTLEHVAMLFHVKADSARQYTYRQDFSPAHHLGARLPRDRDEILDWFRSLPRLSLADRKRADSAVVTGAPVTPRAPRSSQYRRGTGRGQAKAASDRHGPPGVTSGDPSRLRPKAQCG
jgi:hypothetical protein